MNELETVIRELGLTLSAQAIWDFLKSYIAARKQSNIEEVAQALTETSPSLTLDKSRVIASKAVRLFAEHGWIEIRGSYIYGKDSVEMQSSRGQKVTFGEGSTSETSKTKIETGRGASITMQGGAGVRQNEDGSISFHA